MTAAHLVLAAAALAAAVVPATAQRTSSAAGFPIQASANTAPAMRTAIQAGIRTYSSAPRARVTSIRRAGRYWHATSNAPAPYRVLLCTRTYCQATAPAQAPQIRVEVKR